MNERCIHIGSLAVYYTIDERGIHVTYAEQGSRPYVLDDEELTEVLTIITEHHQ